MRADRTLVIGCAASMFLLTFLILYLRFFPILFDEDTSDAIFLAALLFLIVIVLMMALSVRRLRDSALVLLPLSLMAFVARATPNIRLSYPPLNDPYYHFASTQTMISEGTMSASNAWYDLTSFQLHWPDLHILALGLNQVGGVDLWAQFRFLEPFLGVIFLLGTYMLARAITTREEVALLSAALAAFGDVVIFYQSEYHPQGVALVFFVLLMFLFLRSREKSTFSFALLFIITMGAMTLSHHFSSLLVGVMSLAAAGLCLVIPRLRRLDFNPQAMARDFYTLLLVGITALSYHLFVYIEPMRQFVRMIGLNIAGSTSLLSLSLAGEFLVRPFSLLLFTSVKWILLILAICYIAFYFYRMKRDPTIDRVALALFLFIVVGLGALMVPGAPLDRLLAFILPLLTPFVVMLLINARDRRPYSRFVAWRALWLTITVLISVLAIAAGFLNAPNAPSMFFHDSPTNVNFWYSNELPEMDQYVHAGAWTQDSLEDRPRVYTNFDTRTTVFYFGEKYNGFMLPASASPAPPSYILVNPSIPYAFEDNRYETYDHRFNTIYHNGELKMYEVQARA